MELKKFYDNIEIKSNNIVEYKDDEGNISLFPIAGLLCRCEFLKVDDERLKIMRFNKEVNKDMEFDRCDEVVPYQDPKNKSRLLQKTIKVNLMWKVSNNCGISQVFNVKEEATNLVNELNSKYISKVEV